jgi:hypothetical protein
MMHFAGPDYIFNISLASLRGMAQRGHAAWTRARRAPTRHAVPGSSRQEARAWGRGGPRNFGVLMPLRPNLIMIRILRSDFFRSKRHFRTNRSKKTRGGAISHPRNSIFRRFLDTFIASYLLFSQVCLLNFASWTQSPTETGAILIVISLEQT